MAGDKEVAAAYRELAKRWHPDQGGGDEAVRRMAEINAAFDLLRAGAAHQEAPRKPPPGRRRGSWLPDAVRRALGPELLEALSDREAVKFVTPVSTWASPRAVLAVTERRLLWLLDDAPVARVRSLAFRDIAAGEPEDPPSTQEGRDADPEDERWPPPQLRRPAAADGKCHRASPAGRAGALTALSPASAPASPLSRRWRGLAAPGPRRRPARDSQGTDTDAKCSRRIASRSRSIVDRGTPALWVLRSAGKFPPAGLAGLGIHAGKHDNHQP